MLSFNEYLWQDGCKQAQRYSPTYLQTHMKFAVGIGESPCTGEGIMDSLDDGEDLLGSPSPYGGHSRKSSGFFSDPRQMAGGSEAKGVACCVQRKSHSMKSQSAARPFCKTQYCMLILLALAPRILLQDSLSLTCYPITSYE